LIAVPEFFPLVKSLHNVVIVVRHCATSPRDPLASSLQATLVQVSRGTVDFSLDFVRGLPFHDAFNAIAGFQFIVESNHYLVQEAKNDRTRVFAAGRARAASAREFERRGSRGNPRHAQTSSPGVQSERRVMPGR
jgi:hypothetical protein